MEINLTKIELPMESIVGINTPKTLKLLVNCQKKGDCIDRQWIYTQFYLLNIDSEMGISNYDN